MVRPRWETFWGRFIDCWRGSFRGYDVGSRCRFCGSGAWLVDDVSMGGFGKIVLERNKMWVLNIFHARRDSPFFIFPTLRMTERYCAIALLLCPLFVAKIKGKMFVIYLYPDKHIYIVFMHISCTLHP